MSRRARFLTAAAALLITVFLAGSSALAQYQQATPDDHDVGGKPAPFFPSPRDQGLRMLDVAVLTAGLAVAALLVLKLRRRAGIVVLAAAALLYFGFYRGGCICAVGAGQNVALSLADRSYTISIVITAIFLLPILASLFVGRIFCGGVCPLGAIQDLLLVRHLRVPRLLDRLLRPLAWAYLCAAVFFAVGGLSFHIGSLLVNWSVPKDFVVCKYDPFIGVFRAANLQAAIHADWLHVFEVTGAKWMWWATGGILALGLVIGRPYCRWLCPYGALLGLCSRAAARPLTIEPRGAQCLHCKLCEKACPFGAVKDCRAQPSTCLNCGRCFSICPLEKRRRKTAAQP